MELNQTNNNNSNNNSIIIATLSIFAPPCPVLKARNDGALKVVLHLSFLLSVKVFILKIRKRHEKIRKWYNRIEK